MIVHVPNINSKTIVSVFNDVDSNRNRPSFMFAAAATVVVIVVDDDALSVTAVPI